MEEAQSEMLRKLKSFFFLNRYPFWKMYDYNNKFEGYSCSWYIFISAGWQKAFGKQLSKDIKEAGKAARRRLGHHISWKDLVKFADIKEKWGVLRFYAEAVPEIEHVLEKYELLSMGYCEECGKPARYITKGHVEYCCEDCFKRSLPSLMDDDDKVRITNECRLTKDNIPHRSSYTKSAQGKAIKHTVNLKKIYGVDFEKLWGLK